MNPEAAWNAALPDAAGTRWITAQDAGRTWLGARYPQAVVWIEVLEDGTRRVVGAVPEGLAWEPVKE